MKTRNIGNDEGDVECDLCGRRDWFTAVEITYENGLKRIVCYQRFEQESCVDAIIAHVAPVD